MKRTFKIHDEQSIASCTEAICSLVDEEQPHEVEVRPWKRNRSVEQNRLYWEWLTLLSKQTDFGWTKEDFHRYFKHKYAANIFIRDSESYAAMVQTVRKLKGQQGYQELKDWIIDATSTVDFNVKQMSEYMESVELEATSRWGVALPQGEE